ncbi:MAG: DNA integrity scanning diadenylate cyclase DisA [archaeon]
MEEKKEEMIIEESKEVVGNNSEEVVLEKKEELDSINDSIELVDIKEGLNVEEVKSKEKEPTKEKKKRKAEKIEKPEKIETIKPTQKLSEKDFKTITIEKAKSQDDLIKVIKLVAPGTVLRTAISDIVRSNNGALIVVDANGLDKIIEGGFRINCMFTPQRLVELSKMDGAMILSSDMKKILYANTLLAPSIEMPTRETGTRHKAAERTARQLKTFTIAVSERKRTVTLYYDEMKYRLKSSSEILRRATESLQILEKQCEIFEELLLNLNVLEFTNLTNLNDVCLLIQRAETILKISSIIKREIIELGKEGFLIKMRLRELVKDIEKEESLVISDYTRLKTKKTKNLLEVLSFEELLDIPNMTISLGYSENDAPSIANRGYRILNKTELNPQEVVRVIKDFKNFNRLLETPLEDLIRAIKSEGKAIKLQKSLIEMKEQVMLGKKI